MKPSPWPQQVSFQADKPTTGTSGSASGTRAHHVQPLNGYSWVIKLVLEQHKTGLHPHHALILRKRSQDNLCCCSGSMAVHSFQAIVHVSRRDTSENNRRSRPARSRRLCQVFGADSAASNWLLGPAERPRERALKKGQLTFALGKGLEEKPPRKNLRELAAKTPT